MNSLMIWTHGCQLFIYQRRKKKAPYHPARVYSLLLVFFFFGGLIAEMPVMARPQTRAFISYVPSYVWTLSMSQNFAAIPYSSVCDSSFTSCRSAFTDKDSQVLDLSIASSIIPKRRIIACYIYSSFLRIPSFCSFSIW
jgi:hypothetical protein